MVFLLALCLLADGGTEPGVELKVYRAAGELPKDWASLLPADFDFRTEMLATRAPSTARVQLVSGARVERQGAEVRVWAPTFAARPRWCPPCRGVNLREDVQRVTDGPVALAPLFRIRRAKGAVLLMVELRELPDLHRAVRILHRAVYDVHSSLSVISDYALELSRRGAMRLTPDFMKRRAGSRTSWHTPATSANAGRLRARHFRELRAFAREKAVPTASTSRACRFARRRIDGDGALPPTPRRGYFRRIVMPCE